MDVRLIFTNDAGEDTGEFEDIQLEKEAIEAIQKIADQKGISLEEAVQFILVSCIEEIATLDKEENVKK